MFSKKFVCANDAFCDYERPVNAPLFRKTFRLEKLPEKAEFTLNAFEMSGPITFDSNIFYNMPKLPERENIIDKGNYYELNPAWRSEGYTPGNRLDTDGFVPLWDSPLIRMGKHYDVCADKDYNGLNAKGHNYIGAFYYKDANLG